MSENLRAVGGASVPEFGYWVLPDGQRIVVSVMSADLALEVADSIALVVADDGGRRYPVWIGETGPFPGAFTLYDEVRTALRRPNIEVHVHALAHKSSERRTIVEALSRAASSDRPDSIAA